jgi:hypothetical protein
MVEVGRRRFLAMLGTLPLLRIAPPGKRLRGYGRSPYGFSYGR